MGKFGYLHTRSTYPSHSALVRTYIRVSTVIGFGIDRTDFGQDMLDVILDPWLRSCSGRRIGSSICRQLTNESQPQG